MERFFFLGVDIRVARIFNTYGPGMHPYDGRVVSNFIMQVQPASIYMYIYNVYIHVYI